MIGRVARDVAAGEPAALEHGDVGDAVLASPGSTRSRARARRRRRSRPRTTLRLGIAPEEVRVLAAHAAARTSFRSTPIPSISTSTTSPGSSVTFGSRKTPTPSGVPVRIRSPGSSVIAARCTRRAPGCRRSGCSCASPAAPRRSAAAGSAGRTGRARRAATSAGRPGRSVSKLLPRNHWPSPNWKSRALTSFAHV